MIFYKRSALHIVQKQKLIGQTEERKKERHKWINPSKNQFVPKLFATHFIGFSFWGVPGGGSSASCSTHGIHPSALSLYTPSTDTTSNSTGQIDL